MRKIPIVGNINRDDITFYYVDRRKLKKLKRKMFIHEITKGKTSLSLETIFVFDELVGDEYIISKNVYAVFMTGFYIDHPTINECVPVFKQFNDKSEFLKWKLKHA